MCSLVRIVESNASTLANRILRIVDSIGIDLADVLKQAQASVSRKKSVNEITHRTSLV
jgi:hypothetical protein